MSEKESEDWLDKGFESFGRAEWFAVFGAGNFAFRFGPFTGPEVGKIIERAVAENLAVTIVANCGAPVDWDLAAQFKRTDKPEPPAAAPSSTADGRTG